MKVFKILAAGFLSLCLLTSSMLPVFASTESQTTQDNTQLLSEQTTKGIKESTKIIMKESDEGYKYKEANLIIDGIETVVILGEHEQLTDSMIEKTKFHVKNEVRQTKERKSQLSKVNTSALPSSINYPPTEAITYPVGDENATVEESDSYPDSTSIDPIYNGGPSYIPINDGGSGNLIGQRTLYYGKRDAKFVNSVVKGAITSIATAVGFYYGAYGGAVIAGLATTFSEYVNIQPMYAKIRTLESWSSYFHTYLVDNYATYYTSSSFTTVKKVFIRYDIHRVGDIIGM